MNRETVHVWNIDLDAPVRNFGRWFEALAADERERAARFKFEIHRQRFIAGRFSLRTILGRYLGEEADALRFDYTPFGKPTLPGRPLRFNLSHSGALALLAVVVEREVGVDVEQVRANRDLLGLAQRFFAPMEAAAVHSASEQDRALEFYRCWTRKEAYLKARGDGLSLPLDSFTVSTGAGETPRLTSSKEGLGELSRWLFCSLPCSSDFVAALVVEHGPTELQFHNFEVAA